MAAGATYFPIATYTTANTTTTTITFGAGNTLPQTYTDLYLIVSNKPTATPTIVGVTIRLNGDTGSNYSSTYVYGAGGSVGTGRGTNLDKYNFMNAGSTTANQYNMGRLNIMNYANTTTFKTMISRGDDLSDSTVTSIGLWRSTAAVTQLDITATDALYYAVGCTFTLYGLAAA
jgi:hypothetical protein